MSSQTIENSTTPIQVQTAAVNVFSVKTVLFCGMKFGLKRNCRGAKASQSFGGSHGPSSSTTGHLALISLVLRYFAVLHLARSILGLTYSYDLATLRNF